MHNLLRLACFLALVGNSTLAQTARYEARLDATDAGRILWHGDGPGASDTRGMREPSIVQEDGKFYLFYDGCAEPAWLACLATSDDLKTWKKHGRMLSLGPIGSDDSGTASSPWMIKEEDTWHMFYVACPNVTPAPDFIPAGPYLTMKATAKSLMGPWTQHREFVPFRPKPGTHYALGAYPGHILKHKDEYMMFINGGQAIARTSNLNEPWKIDEKPHLQSSVENSSIYYEETNGYYWLFVNHIRMLPSAHTDATWVYWSKDPNNWNERDRAVVLDGRNCSWSKTIIGMATVTKVGNRLALFYDANEQNVHHHMDRDIGLAWLDLPLTPEKVRLLALPPSEDDDVSKNLGDWIWHPTVGESAATVYFEGTFDLPIDVKPEISRLVITADDTFTVWLNGTQVGSGSSWQKMGVFDATAYLAAGKNRMSIKVENGGGPGGVIAGLTTWLPDGSILKFGTSGDWKSSLIGNEKWFEQETLVDGVASMVRGNLSAPPWHLTSPDAEGMPSILASQISKATSLTPNTVLCGGFEGDVTRWKITGGDRIAYDWSRFPRDRWMGDYYLWLNGPDAEAEQISTVLAQPGDTVSLTAQVGYSADIRDGNLPWPGGRMVLFTLGPDGSQEEVAEKDLPQFNSEDAGTFKTLALKWKVPKEKAARKIGVRLESKGPQTSWDNIRLENAKR